MYIFSKYCRQLNGDKLKQQLRGPTNQNSRPGDRLKWFVKNFLVCNTKNSNYENIIWDRFMKWESECRSKFIFTLFPDSLGNMSDEKLNKKSCRLLQLMPVCGERIPQPSEATYILTFTMIILAQLFILSPVMM